MIRSTALFSTIAFILTTFSFSYATHIQAGYIHVDQKDFNSLEMYITIFYYTNNQSSVPFGGGTLDFGDESEPITLPVISTASGTISLSHTYRSSGNYRISYTEPNRGEVNNIPSSVNTRFHLETSIVINPKLGPVNTSNPLLDLFHIFHVDQINSLALTMRKVDDEMYTYTFTTPMKGRNDPINDYIMPAHVTLDYHTGQFIWDLTKDDPVFNFSNNNYYEAFTFAINANQYKIIDNELIKKSSTLIDFQVSVYDPAEEINISGDEIEHVIQNNNTINISRVFRSTEKSDIEIIATDLPDGSYIIDHIAYTDSTTVNIEVHNNNIADNGPYFIAIRSRTTQSFKDDVITIYFNEKNEDLTAIISSVNQTFNPELVMYPNPAKDFVQFNFQGYDHLQLALYRIDGRMIYQKRIQSGDIVNIKEGGVFLYTLTSGNKLVGKGKILGLDK